MNDKSQPGSADGPYLYGDKRTPEIVLDAVIALGKPVSVAEVKDYLAKTLPHFNLSNVSPDLCSLTVNCNSRGHFKENREPRRTDTGNPFDRLIRTGDGRETRFSLYDPGIHGVWELVDVGDKALRPRFVCTSEQAAVALARTAAEANPAFEPDEDLRKWITASIVQREGQPAFRRSLLKAYAGRCAISGCAVEDVLEAAHIAPYRGVPTNVVGNGLLLRADLHKLFDLCLIAIDADTRTVRLHDALRQSEYAVFEGVRLRDAVEPGLAPYADALKRHWERCVWVSVRGDDVAE